MTARVLALDAVGSRPRVDRPALMGALVDDQGGASWTFRDSANSQRASRSVRSVSTRPTDFLASWQGRGSRVVRGELAAARRPGLETFLESRAVPPPVALRRGDPAASADPAPAIGDVWEEWTRSALIRPTTATPCRRGGLSRIAEYKASHVQPMVLRGRFRARPPRGAKSGASYRNLLPPDARGNFGIRSPDSRALDPVMAFTGEEWSGKEVTLPPPPPSELEHESCPSSAQAFTNATRGRGRFGPFFVHVDLPMTVGNGTTPMLSAVSGPLGAPKSDGGNLTVLLCGPKRLTTAPTSAPRVPPEIIRSDCDMLALGQLPANRASRYSSHFGS